MKGDPKVIDYMNKALRNELTTVNQYFMHARMLENWGFKKLGDYEYNESLDEMRHADSLIKRILFLEGLPNLQDLGKLEIGENVPEIIRCDLKQEQNAHPLYKEAVTYCDSVGDYVTRDLLAAILQSEEDHIDWLETQLSLIESMGIENYLQAQV